MKTNLLSIAAGLSLAVAALSPAPAEAHFKLLKPANWLKTDDLGGPQKGSPCGPGGADNKSPIPTSGAITEFKAGETISMEWEVTIPHPGWFRIALAEDRADLKDPDIARDGLCNVDESKIPKAPYGNVLADGLFLNSDESSFKFDLKLPDKPCEKCTLQVIQFMELHPPSCYYFHCADIKIVAGDNNGSQGANTSDAGPSKGSSEDAGKSSADAGRAAPASNPDASSIAHGDGEEHATHDAKLDAGKVDAGVKKDAGATSGSSSTGAQKPAADEDDESAEDESDKDTDDEKPSDDDKSQTATSSDDGCTLSGNARDTTGSALVMTLLGLFLYLHRRRASKSP